MVMTPGGGPGAPREGAPKGGGRGSERYARLRWSAGASAFSRGLSFVVTLVLIGLVSRYLGPDRLGLWLTIIGLYLMLSLADIGLGNGLVNALAESHGKERPDVAAGHVATAFYLLCAVAVLLGALFTAIYPHVDWGTLLNVRSAAARAESGPAVAILVACVLSSLPLGLSQKVHLGYQEGFIASAWSSVGSCVSLAAGIVFAEQRAGVAALTLAVLGGQVVGLVLNTVALYGFHKPHLRPKPGLIRLKSARRLYSLGGLYFALALAGAVGLQADNLIIARILGTDAVPRYAIPLRIFLLVPTVLSFALAPLWPAYAESVARGDNEWVRRTFRRSIQMSIGLAIPSSIGLVLSARFVIDRWAGPELAPPLHLLVGFGLWASLTAVTGPLAMLLNGLGVIGLQVISSLTMALMNVGISILLVSRIGVAGAIYGTVISLLFCIVLPSTFYVSRIFTRSAISSRGLADD